jgi:hypothetical protein
LAEEKNETSIVREVLLFTDITKGERVRDRGTVIKLSRELAGLRRLRDSFERISVLFMVIKCSVWYCQME